MDEEVKGAGSIESKSDLTEKENFKEGYNEGFRKGFQQGTQKQEKAEKEKSSGKTKESGEERENEDSQDSEKNTGRQDSDKDDFKQGYKEGFKEAFLERSIETGLRKPEPVQLTETIGTPAEKATHVNDPAQENFKQGFEQGFAQGFETGKQGSKKEEKPEGQSEDEKSKGKEDPKEKQKSAAKRRRFIIVAIIIGIVLLIVGLIIWLMLRQYVSTDDAYVDGHIVQIAPRVSAQVIALHIQDNQLMHKGDLLLELDPTDYQVALDQAAAQVDASRGKLEQARAQVNSAKAQIPQALAQENSAHASFLNASNDFQRYLRVDPRARSREQLENAGTTQTNAAAQLDQAHAQVVVAEANVVTAQASVNAAEGDLKTAKANEERARVNLSYCKIFAPADGRVTQRTVETGNFVAVGQALFLLVDPNVWVTANFKETQLTHMAPGQPVTFTVDAFPRIKFHGHVDSIQAGSGSRFSVLPAENATGNYVKIVQRVPVKILFDHNENTNNAGMLSPGLSVAPRVKIR